MLHSGALITTITGTGLPAELPARVVVPASEGPETRPSGWDPRPVMSVNARRDPIRAIVKE